MADHEFEKDARGRFAGKNRHTPSSTAEPATEATRYSDEVFCKQIANHLEQNFDSHNYSEISIVAAPAFMGMLRKKISKKIHNIIKEEICKDVTSLSTHKMYAYLKEYLH